MSRSTSWPGPLSWLTSWRVCLRMARRDILRAKGRSALVVAMIGIPVLLLSAGSVLYRTGFDRGPVTEALQRLGMADAYVRVEGPGVVDHAAFAPVLDQEVEFTPSDDVEPWTRRRIEEAIDARLVPYHSGMTLVRTDEGALSAVVREVDLRERAAAGLVEPTDGRLPQKAEEVVVSEPLAERGIRPGDRIRVGTELDRTFTVVGSYRDPLDLTAAGLIGLPGGVVGADASTGYLVDTGGRPVTAADVERLNRHGISVSSRAALLSLPPEPSSTSAEERAILVLIAVGVVLEVVLLAGPAFAVSARRQRRRLGLLVAVGGVERHVRRTVLAQALVLGAGSAVAGAVLGIGLAAVARPLVEPMVGFALEPLRVEPLDLVGLVVAGTLAALLAALLPARQAARQDPVVALAGRRGETRTHWGRPVAGALLAAAGSALILIGSRWTADGEYPVAAGTVGLVLGAVVASPSLVGAVGRLGARLPLALRLATRDAARQRSRTAPAVAAIMGVVAGVTALGIGAASDAAEAERDYRPSARMGAMTVTFETYERDVPADTLASLVDRIEQVLPGHTAHVTREVPYGDEQARVLAVRSAACWDADVTTCPFHPSRERFRMGALFYGGMVADAETVAAHFGDLDDERRQEFARVLDAGGALVADPKAVDADGRTRLLTYVEAWDENGEPQARDVREHRVPAAVLPPLEGRQAEYLAEVVIGRETAERLGLEARVSQILVPPTGEPITPKQETQVDEYGRGLAPDLFESATVERGYQDPTRLVYVVLGVIGGLIILVGTGTATALAIDDAGPDLATLSAVGAAPGTRRRTAMSQAAVIAGLGVLLGIAVGVVPGVAVTWPLTAPSPGGHVLEVPWALLGTLAVGVPLLAVSGAGLFTRSRLPLVRRAT